MPMIIKVAMKMIIKVIIKVAMKMIIKVIIKVVMRMITLLAAPRMSWMISPVFALKSPAASF